MGTSRIQELIPLGCQQFHLKDSRTQFTRPLLLLMAQTSNDFGIITHLARTIILTAVRISLHFGDSSFIRSTQ